MHCVDRDVTVPESLIHSFHVYYKALYVYYIMKIVDSWRLTLYRTAPSIHSRDEYHKAL